MKRPSAVIATAVLSACLAAAGPAVAADHHDDTSPLGPQLRYRAVTWFAALRGTPGLKVLVASGHGRGDSASGELRYTWTPEGAETRFVAYRYQGNDAYMVAGPLRDQEGLEAVLRTAALTGECS